jgi:hypothetical protein
LYQFDCRHLPVDEDDSHKLLRKGELLESERETEKRQGERNED